MSKERWDRCWSNPIGQDYPIEPKRSEEENIKTDGWGVYTTQYLQYTKELIEQAHKKVPWVAKNLYKLLTSGGQNDRKS